MIRILFFISLLPFSLFSQVSKDCTQAMPFSTIQIYDGINVLLEKGTETYLCPGTDTKIDDLSINLTDGALKIRKIPGRKYDKPLRVKIIYTELKQIEAYNKSDVDMKNLLKSDSLNVIVKSGALVYVELDIKHLTVDVTEGALFKAQGYAVEQDIRVAMKATFSGFDLEGDSGTVKAVTGGVAKVNLEKKIDALASSGGQVRYKGQPSMDTKTSLGGKIQSIGDQDDE